MKTVHRRVGRMGGAWRRPRPEDSRTVHWRKWGAVLASAGVIFSLSSLPGEDIVMPAVVFAGADKVAHILLYAGFAVACYRAFVHAAGRWAAAYANGLTVVTALGYGLLTEWYQSIIPGRTAEAWDVVADGLGALLAILIWRHLRRHCWTRRPAYVEPPAPILQHRLLPETLGCLCFVIMWLIVDPAMAAVTATEAIKGTSHEVIRLLHDEDLRKPWNVLERRRRLEQVIGDRFNYEEMSRRALGDQWHRLTGEERQEFTRLFTTLLAATYANQIEGYAERQVSFVQERVEHDYAEVRTRLISGKSELPIDFRLVETSGEWRVYDMIVDGISLINNYRSQFLKILHASSYANLAKQLRRKSHLPEVAAGSPVQGEPTHSLPP